MWTPRPRSHAAATAIEGGAGRAGCPSNSVPGPRGPRGHGGADEGPNPPGEGWACGDPLGMQGPQGSRDPQGSGDPRAAGPVATPRKDAGALCCWRALLQLLSQRPRCCLRGTSTDVSFWTRQLPSFHTERWHFSPCWLWNSHGEAVCQRCVCIQPLGPSASLPLSPGSAALNEAAILSQWPNEFGKFLTLLLQSLKYQVSGKWS